MEQTKRPRKASLRVLSRVAATAFAVGGLSAVTAIGTAGAATQHTTNVTVSTAKSASLGTFLVSGKTLYTLSKADCTAKCLKFWPALMLPKGATKATAGKGVSAAKLGTVKVAGGLQVTYGGKALYWYVGDTKSGQVHGNGLKDTWGTWSAVVTAKKAASSGSGGTVGGGNTGTGGVAF